LEAASFARRKTYHAEGEYSQMAISGKAYRWYYDTIACRYYDLMIKWCFLPFGGETTVRSEILDAASPVRGERILDMCCGTGSVTFAAAERAGEQSQIIGLDLSLGQIRVAQKRNRRPNVGFIAADAAQTPFCDSEFDRIIITHAVHEMTRPLRLAVFTEAGRILKPKGVLAVLEMDSPPTLPWRLLIGFFWFYWLPFNFETPTRRDMLRHGVVEEVGEAGFDEVEKTSLFHGAFQVVQGIR
jgi:demethylmenaquinone methyltransferase/2-methoxy-6-polyprenyl-1,4-benzoquinol methylase